MSRMAQQLQAMVDQLGKKKGRRHMDGEQAENLGGESLGGSVEDVNNASAAGAADGIEPDSAPAGAGTMKTAKKAKAGKSTAKKAASKAQPKAAAKGKTAKTAKASKTAKSKPAKAAKAPKAPKEAKPKVAIGVDLSGSLKVASVEGGDKNQFVNITFADGRGVKLWPSGYPEPKDRLKARDAMVAFLSKALL